MSPREVRGAPAHLHEDPPFYAEGLRWLRMDISPPVERIFQDGRIYERPYALAPGESEPPAPGGTSAPEEAPPVFPILSGEDDQHLYANSPTYPPAAITTRIVNNSNVAAGRTKTSGTGSYNIFVALLRFDTSSLPDAASVTNATLRAYVSNTMNADGRSLRGEYYAWDGVSATDYATDGTVGTTAFETPISALAAGENDLVLSNLSFINKTGTTHLRLHVTGGEPTGYNQVSIGSFEGVYSEPRLIVTHT